MILTATQQIELAIKPLDRKGNPAQVDGIPQWSSSNTEAITLQPHEDGLSCIAIANKLGDAQVSVKADADLGEGVEFITGALDITVVAGKASMLTILTVPPVEQAI